MGFLNNLKKLPIDVGQANLRKTTKGKLIALSLVKKARSGQAALDIGCREGYQSRWLEKKGYSVTSIDVEKNYEKCIVVNVDEGLPFPDNSFDLIWCSEVIEHLTNPKASVKEFHRVLSPGGRMIITTPNSHFWLMKLFSMISIHPKKLQNPDHKHFFKVKDMKNLFPGARIYGFFPYAILKFRIRRFVGFLSPTFVIYSKVM